MPFKTQETNANNARRVMECHSTQETRVKRVSMGWLAMGLAEFSRLHMKHYLPQVRQDRSAVDDVASNYGRPYRDRRRPRGGERAAGQPFFDVARRRQGAYTRSLFSST